MPQGSIKKLVADNGFGFIAGERGGDIFFHHSAVEDHGFDQLHEGQAVEYQVDSNGGKGGKGPRAVSVKPA